MTINKRAEDNTLILALEGRLDTTTAPQLEDVINSDLGNFKELILDFDKLEYLSSAGLRVILAAQKRVSKQGCMKVCHVNSSIMEIFDVTGFTDILTIE